MPGAPFHTDPTGFRDTLQRDYLNNTTWPPNRASLTALIDLGLSDDCIADYFRVSRPEVISLRQAYSLMQTKMTFY